VGGQCHAPAAILVPPGKSRYPLYVYEAGGPKGQSGRVQNTSPKSGLILRIFQPVASRYTGCAIRGHDTILYVIQTLRLRVCERSVLRRIFGPKKVEVTGAWLSKACVVFSLSNTGVVGSSSSRGMEDCLQ